MFIEKYKKFNIIKLNEHIFQWNMTMWMIINDMQYNMILYSSWGTGKTTISMLLMHKLYESEDDFTNKILILNAWYDRGIKVIKERIKWFMMLKNSGKQKIILMDEADILWMDSQLTIKKMLNNNNNVKFI